MKSFRFIIIVICFFALSACSNSNVSENKINKSQSTNNIRTMQDSDAKEKTIIEETKDKNSDTQHSEKTIINDIANWEHPAKLVFNNLRNGELTKVEIINKTYPIFYMDFFEGDEDYTLFYDLAVANGYWDYKLVSDGIDSPKTFEVSIDKVNKRVKSVKSNNGDLIEYKLISQNMKLKENDFDTFIKNDIQSFENIFSLKMERSNEHVVSYTNHGKLVGFDCNNIHINTLDDYVTMMEYQKTIRGIQAEDTLDKLKEKYGEPNLIINKVYKDFPQEDYYVYFGTGKNLEFRVVGNIVKQIFISVENCNHHVYK